MANRAIGIDIGKRQVRAVQLVRAGQGVRVECCQTQDIAPRGGADEVAQALQSLIHEPGFGRRAPPVAAMPAGSVLFHAFETNLSDARQLRRVLAFELEDDLAVDMDEAVVDICAARELPDGGQRILAAATRRGALDGLLAALQAAGLRCQTVDAQPCALNAAVARVRGTQADEPYAFAQLRDGHATLGVADGEGLLTARSLPVIAAEGTKPIARFLRREVEMSWRETTAERPERAELWLAGEPERLAELAGLLADRAGFATRVLDPCAAMECDEAVGPEYAVAVGLALRGLGMAPGGLDLVAAGEFEQVRAAATRRAVALLVVLLCLAALAWTGRLFLRLRRLDAEHARVEAEMREVFRRTLPAVRYVGQPLAQLNAHLGELRAEYDAFASVGGEAWSPLRVLHRISEATPPRLSVKVVELSIGPRTVRLKGYTDSFRSVESLEAALAALPEFASVKIQDTDLRAGQLTFTLAMVLASR